MRNGHVPLRTTPEVNVWQNQMCTCHSEQAKSKSSPIRSCTHRRMYLAISCNITYRGGSKERNWPSPRPTCTSPNLPARCSHSSQSNLGHAMGALRVLRRMRLADLVVFHTRVSTGPC